MAKLIGVFVGLTTYVILFKVLFQDFVEFRAKLKGTTIYYSIALFLDALFNWSPSFRKISIRVLLWLPSGLATGAVVYHYLK